MLFLNENVHILFSTLDKQAGTKVSLSIHDLWDLFALLIPAFNVEYSSKIITNMSPVFEHKVFTLQSKVVIVFD